MKNIILITLLCALFTTACRPNKKEKAEALFTDPVMQEEIFSAILNDTARLHNFFNKFQAQRNPAMGRMHQHMMKKMCCTSGMDSIMMCDGAMQGNMMRHMLKQTDRDSMFCKQMGDSVMRHDRLRKHLHQQMEPGGQRKKGMK